MKDITKKYTNGEVTIVWKPATCIHSTVCWKQATGLPEVFKPAEKPWINPDGATTEAIVAQVKKCPSGALSYYMNDNQFSIRIFAYGITKEILGSSVIDTKISATATVQDVKQMLEDMHPALKQLTSLVIAVNQEYALPDKMIKEGDEIALIPPVSGG